MGVVPDSGDGLREAVVILPSGRSFEGRARIDDGALFFRGKARPVVEGRQEIERTWPIANVRVIKWGRL